MTPSFLASLSQVLTPASDNMADQLRTTIQGICDAADALDHNSSSSNTVKLLTQLRDAVDRFVKDSSPSAAQKNPLSICPFNVSFSTGKSRDTYYNMKLDGDPPAGTSQEEWVAHIEKEKNLNKTLLEWRQYGDGKKSGPTMCIMCAEMENNTADDWHATAVVTFSSQFWVFDSEFDSAGGSVSVQKNGNKSVRAPQLQGIRMIRGLATAGPNDHKYQEGRYAIKPDRQSWSIAGPRGSPAGNAKCISSAVKALAMAVLTYMIGDFEDEAEFGAAWAKMDGGVGMSDFVEMRK
jgi:hypothetical protein